MTRTTENVSPLLVPAILRRLTTTRKLQIIVLVFVCIVFAVLGLVYLGSQVTTAARAYVGGESLWSKSQKEAAIRLQEYADSKDEKDYRDYLEALAVPLGDRVARLEMEKANPNVEVIFGGFRQGKIPEGDIAGLIMLFRRFRKTQLIETAASIWEQGDRYIDEMRQEGSELHDEISTGRADTAKIAALRKRIKETDNRLTPLEYNFSAALSAGARRIETLLAIGLAIAACSLLALGLAISMVVAREIDASETERNRAEEATRESERRYRELLENANDIVYVHDLRGEFLSWNRKAEELLGYQMNEVRGLRVRDVVAPEDHALVEEMTARKLNGESTPPYGLRLIAKDGRRCEVEVSSRVLFEGENAIGIQGIARDLTERRRLEAELLQAQKMEAVGRLAGGIAHDFNNILMIVRGYAESIEERLHEQDPLRGLAEQISKAATRGAALTQRLLGFSRKQVFEPKVLQLNSLVSEIAKMLPRLLSAEIELSFDLRPEAGNVSADPIQLEQVLINLVVNARDAMQKGGKLTISTGSRQLGERAGDPMPVVAGAYAEIAVQDSGTGIDAETQRHIFEPFFTTKEKDKGTGLGLSTVYGIVKRSGGYIFVESQVGIGTTVRIYLPQVQAPPEEAVPEEIPEAVAERTGTILIAEDEDSLRALIAQRMRAEGFQVLEAANGEEALALAASHRGPIRILLTDVIMPKLRGPEVAARLRMRYPEMKVIFMSGYTESALVRDGMLEKNTVLLQKPFTLKKILEVIQELNLSVR